MEIDFEKYFVNDADEFREGYEKSLELIKKLGEIRELKELFRYKDVDLLLTSQHGLALFFTEIMSQIESRGKISIGLKQRLKSEVKRFLRNFKKKEKIIKNAGSRKKAVIILYSSSQADTIFPVINKLKERNNLDITVIAGDFFSQTKLKKESIEYNSFDSYFPDEIKKIIRIEKKRFSKTWKIIGKNRFFYKKIELWNIIRGRFLDEFIGAIEQVEAINKIIDFEKPEVIVTATDISSKGKTETLIAKNRRIPCIVSQHGAAIDCPYYQPTFADKFAVWGKITKDMLIRRGYDGKKIEIVGSTKYDGIKIPDKIPKGEFILITTQMLSKKEQMLFLDAVISACRNINERIIINLHPGQKSKLIEEYLKKYNVNAEIIPGQPAQGINYFIERCKALVTVCSTTAIDAILYNKPVVTVNLSGKKDFIPFADYGVAIGVYGPEKVLWAVNEALNNGIKEFNKNRGRFLKEYAYNDDKMASLRFTELIEKI